MSSKYVTIHIQKKIALFTINNSASHNALSRAVMVELIAAFDSMNGNEDVRAIVLTGSGNKAFSVGLDLKELAETGEITVGDQGDPSMGPDSPLVKSIATVEQPVIGAINGFAVTGGFELALACDFLVCSDNAQFADTHALVGLLPGWGLSQKLPRLIGLNRAKEISFTGNYIGAEEAYRLGLVNRVYSQNDLLVEARKIAQRIAVAEPRALYQIKRLMSEGSGLNLDDALIMEGQVAETYNGALDKSYLEQRLKELRQLAKD